MELGSFRRGHGYRLTQQIQGSWRVDWQFAMSQLMTYKEDKEGKKRGIKFE